MKSVTAKFLSGSALASLIACSAAPAFAQDAQPAEADQRNEIIVTARKVEESVQDVPVAITAFDAEALRERSISELEDIAMQTPGLVFEDYSNGGFGTPTIRGATQFSITGLEQNVSVFLDGIYIPRQYAFDLGAANLERIEVVKGPQGALYGANAFAGAINYVTSNRSLDELEASAVVEASENGGFDIAGNISVPLAEGIFSARLAVGYSEFGGDWDNNHPDADLDLSPGTTGKIGGYENEMIQAGFSFQPDEMIRFDFDYYNFQTESETRAQYRLSRGSGDFNCSDGGQFTNAGLQLFCGELPTEPIPGASGVEGFVIDPRTYGLVSESEFFRAAVEVNPLENVALNYVLGYSSGNVFSAGGSDRDALVPTVFGGATGNSFTFNPVGNFEYFSHEVRLAYQGDSGFYAMAGVFFQDGEDFDQGTGGLVPFRGTDPITELPSDVRLVDALTELETQAIFGRVAIPLFDERLTIELEGRYTEERKDVADLSTNSPYVYEDNYFTPRANISFDVTPDNLLYASIARGVKSGGVNSTNGVLSDEERFYGADTNWTYEIGSKNTIMDGRGTLNLAAFYIDWSNLQLQVSASGASFFSANIIQDLGGASSHGLEIDGTFEPVDGLILNAGLAYINASYDDGVISNRITRSNLCGDGLVCNADGDIGGNQIQRTSDWQWNAGVSYSTPLTSSIDLFTRLDVAGQSEQFVSELNATTIPSRTLTNARLGIEGDMWSASVWAKNVFDEQYVANAFFIATPFFTDYVPTLGNRRRIGVTLSFDY